MTIRSSLSPPLISFDLLGLRTLCRRRLSRPHLHRVLHHVLRPTHRRRFKRQQGAWRAAVAVRRPPTAVRRLEREWFMRSHLSHHGYPPTQRYATGSSATVEILPRPATTSPSFSKKVMWCVSIALGPSSSLFLCDSRLSISLILDPIALPPPPTSPSPTHQYPCYLWRT
jgi:hypothetical protein